MSDMIRTTVRIDDDLFKEARKRAIDEQKPFAELVNDALAKHLDKPRKKQVKNSGTEFLGKLIEIGKKYKLAGPKDLAKNLDKYLWDQYDHNR